MERSPQIEYDKRPHKSGPENRDCGGREMIPHQCQGGNEDSLLDSLTAQTDTFQVQFSLQVAANDKPLALPATAVNTCSLGDEISFRYHFFLDIFPVLGLVNCPHPVWSACRPSGVPLL